MASITLIDHAQGAGYKPRQRAVVPRLLSRAGYEILLGPTTRAGEHAGERLITCFTATDQNQSTRLASPRAVDQFFNRCEGRGLRLQDLEPIHSTCCIDRPAAKPMVKQYLAAIRRLFDYLVTDVVLTMNPAGSMRGPKHIVK